VLGELLRLARVEVEKYKQQNLSQKKKIEELNAKLKDWEAMRAEYDKKMLVIQNESELHIREKADLENMIKVL